MNETMKLKDNELDQVSGGRREGHYDYVPDSCGGKVGQYDIKPGEVYWINNGNFDAAHYNNRWQRVVVEKVWEEPHRFLFWKYTERMVTFINCETGSRETHIAKNCLNYCSEKY